MIIIIRVLSSVWLKQSWMEEEINNYANYEKTRHSWRHPVRSSLRLSFLSQPPSSLWQRNFDHGGNKSLHLRSLGLWLTLSLSFQNYHLIPAGLASRNKLPKNFIFSVSPQAKSSSVKKIVEGTRLLSHSIFIARWCFSFFLFFLAGVGRK